MNISWTSFIDILLRPSDIVTCLLFITVASLVSHCISAPCYLLHSHPLPSRYLIWFCLIFYSLIWEFSDLYGNRQDGVEKTRKTITSDKKCQHMVNLISFILLPKTLPLNNTQCLLEKLQLFFHLLY